ncbi:hypothetical protein [Sorangium sp. So ce388]|uniref:hypothetical protein n=1 Tax=Sorangium sp. So ce388 TaxID=3133309 RepID=UPI003F5C59AF
MLGRFAPRIARLGERIAAAKARYDQAEAEVAALPGAVGAALLGLVAGRPAWREPPGGQLPVSRAAGGQLAAARAQPAAKRPHVAGACALIQGERPRPASCWPARQRASARHEPSHADLAAAQPLG